ncbi:hypothetical protein ACE939_00175 [Aquimarina sp. W85]|uniref:hypothetical protein n=1 Tax=Aquimarina rhodophyticola TaxID=3342246 RepID=UPI00366B82A0
MKSTIFLMSFVLFYNLSFSQETPTTEQLEMIYQFSYEINKGLFETPVYAYKQKTFDYNERFKKNSIPQDSMFMALDSVVKNASIKVEKGSFGYNLILESEFPSIGEFGEDYGNMEVELTNTEILTGDQDTIKVQTIGGGTSFGGGFNYSNINGKEINYNYRTLNKQSQILSDIDSTMVFKGKAQYKFSFLTDYEVIRLSKANIGEKFKLGADEYVLIDVFDNKIVLEKVITEGIDSDIDIDIINLSKNGKKEFRSYPLFELEELKKKNKKYKDVQSFASSRMGIYKKNYDIFKNKKDITLDEFKQLLPLENLKKLKKERQYTILAGPAPFDHNFLLYIPVFDVERTFEVHL